MEERVGEAFELDERLTVVGGKVRPGDTAPDFNLDSFDPINANMQSVKLADSSGMVRILNVINSLDTPVCHTETRYWEKVRAELPSNVSVYTVSMDLPYAQARWRTTEGVTHQTLSAHRSEQFGQDYGCSLRNGVCCSVLSSTGSLYPHRPIFLVVGRANYQFEAHSRTPNGFMRAVPKP